MDIQIPINLYDELLDDVVESKAKLNLASGEITSVEYTNYDIAKQPLPAKGSDYQLTFGIMKIQEKEVEFAVEVDTKTGEYCVNATELEDIKEKATQLISGPKPTKKSKKRI